MVRRQLSDHYSELADRREQRLNPAGWRRYRPGRKNRWQAASEFPGGCLLQRAPPAVRSNLAIAYSGHPDFLILGEFAREDVALRDEGLESTQPGGSTLRSGMSQKGA